MQEKDHRIVVDKVKWTYVDLFSLKRKGLTNDKISKMTGMPIHIIDDHLAELEEVRKSSGVF